MGIKGCPVDGDERTRGLVPQECQGESEKHKPSRRIRDRVVCRTKSDECSSCNILTSFVGFKKCHEFLSELDEFVLAEEVEDVVARDKVGKAEAATNGDYDVRYKDDDGADDDAGDEAGDEADNEDDGDNEGDDENEGDYSNWENCDSNGGDAPELLFYVSGKRKIPACAVNATEEGAKGHQEKDMQVLWICMLWDIERRDVCGVDREGS